MAIFRKDSEQQSEIEKQQEEIFEFPFEVLWQDEEPSSLLTYVPAIIQIILLIIILFRMKH